MRISWSDPLSGRFDELLLQTIADEGEEAALARVIAKLDEAALATRRANLSLLTMIPGTAALDWLEARIETPIVEDWGRTAALLGIRWDRLAAWITRGRPHSLAALDALVAFARPGPGASLLHRAVQPLLVDPPSLADLRDALASLLTSDDSPRASKTVNEILKCASEILGGGPSLGMPVRAFWERTIAEQQAERLLWSESRGELRAPDRDLVTGRELGIAWQRRWRAAVRACERRGGTGSVRVGRTLERAQLDAIEGELGFAIPETLADLFASVAADVEVTWRLPDDCELPAQFSELAWGGCAWDARRLPELERRRRRWVEVAFPDRDDEYDRVWHDKLAILDVPNGDLIAVDISRSDRAPVVYLSHECGRGHGRVLGSSVTDFIDRWSLLACAGPEEWLMTPFLQPDQPYLDAVGVTAQAWRAWFGVDTMTLV